MAQRQVERDQESAPEIREAPLPEEGSHHRRSRSLVIVAIIVVVIIAVFLLSYDGAVGQLKHLARIEGRLISKCGPQTHTTVSFIQQVVIYRW